MTENINKYKLWKSFDKNFTHTLFLNNLKIIGVMRVPQLILFTYN